MCDWNKLYIIEIFQVRYRNHNKFSMMKQVLEQEDCSCLTNLLNFFRHRDEERGEKLYNKPGVFVLRHIDESFVHTFWLLWKVILFRCSQSLIHHAYTGVQSSAPVEYTGTKSQYTNSGWEKSLIWIVSGKFADFFFFSSLTFSTVSYLMYWTINVWRVSPFPFFSVVSFVNYMLPAVFLRGFFFTFFLQLHIMHRVYACKFSWGTLRGRNSL